MAKLYTSDGKSVWADIHEPNADEIPVVALEIEGSLPKSKDAGEVSAYLFYRSKSRSFSCPVTLKVQGSSSAALYPKKNYTIKLFKDAEHTTKNKKQFMDWKSASKYVLKANWIDHSHARNIVNARLWAQVYKSRADFFTLPNALQKAQIAVDGFPIKVYGNGEYQGLYTWNLPKSAIMGIDDELDTNALLESGGEHPASIFRDSTDTDNDWGDETHDVMPSAIRTSWNNVLHFVSTSTDAQFTANFANYFDKQSVIDQYIFIYLACIVDNLNKNQFFVTYDSGAQYFGAMYDMDGTWGCPCFLPVKSDWFSYDTPCQSGYTVCNNGGRTNLLYERVASLFAADVATRYAELRNGVLSDANIVAEFDKFTGAIPPYLYAEDAAETTAGGAFTNIPLLDSNNILQIRGFVRSRGAYVDTMILGQ